MQPCDASQCEVSPPDAIGAPDEIIVSHPDIPGGHVHLRWGHLQQLQMGEMKIQGPEAFAAEQMDKNKEES